MPNPAPPRPQPNARQEDWLVRSDWTPGDVCDSCIVITVSECPGDAAHCAAGEHCTSTDAACAVTPDHGPTCESCGAPIGTREADLP